MAVWMGGDRRKNVANEHSVFWWILLALVLIVYLSVSLHRLADFPPIGQDEPWIAAAPYKLATQGVYGSDLFAGYYNMDRHDFDHMPVYPLFQAAVFKLFSAGVLQMRMLPAAFGFALLLAVVAAGRQAGDIRMGILGAAMLTGLRIGGADDRTGILVLDLARINRYDIAVPVFGLAALLAFNRGRKDGSGRAFAAAGALAGLATLSHLYGAFWLPVFLVVLALGRKHFFRERASFLLPAGFAVALTPWLAYIAGNWSDYLNQMRAVADRFEIFQPSFYVANVLHEIDRYRPIGLFAAGGAWFRPGAWAALAGIPRLSS